MTRVGVGGGCILLAIVAALAADVAMTPIWYHVLYGTPLAEEPPSPLALMFWPLCSVSAFVIGSSIAASGGARSCAAPSFPAMRQVTRSLGVMLALWLVILATEIAVPWWVAYGQTILSAELAGRTLPVGFTAGTPLAVLLLPALVAVAFVLTALRLLWRVWRLRP